LDDYRAAGEGLAAATALGDGTCIEPREAQAETPRPALTTMAAARRVEDRGMDRLLEDHAPRP
jgi:hypothetical protein